MNDLNRIKEKYLLELLDETKRVVSARFVIMERNIGQYAEILKPEVQPLAKCAVGVLDQEILDGLLTAMMVLMGYRIPSSDFYSLPDYGMLCDWLGEKEEDGKQRWEEG